MDSIYIVMPAYNEEDNIENVVSEWYPKLAGKTDNSRLVIADYGSKDETHNILLSLKSTKYPKLEILKNDNQYHGPKLIALYNFAEKNGIDFIFQTDSDGQTNADEFDSFWELRGKYDGVFGYRPKRGDGKKRAFVEKVVCVLLYIFFGVKVPDANAPFRLMKTSVVKKYIDRLPVDYNIPNIMITTYYAFYHERYLFKEVSFGPRAAGVNSVDLKKIVKIGWGALGDFIKLRKEMMKG